jgi:signal transduction histidine kinase/CheY-like chemotaxis protein
MTSKIDLARKEAGLPAATVADFVVLAPMPLAHCDGNLRVLVSSPSWRRELGETQALQALWPSAKAALADTAARAAKGRATLDGLSVVTPDGRRLSWRLALSPCGRRGVDGYLVEAHDITELAEVRERAEHAKDCVRLAAEIAGVSFFEVDYLRRTYTRHGNLEVLLDWTPTFEDVLAEVWCACLPEDRESALAQFSAHIAAGNEAGRMEYRMNRRDGKEVWVSAASRVDTEVDGSRTRIVGAQIDITERKRNEAAMAKAQAVAEAATVAKSEFLANMSHEIRTPMNGVIGMTGLLLRTPLTPEQRRYCGAVKQSGDALLSIINDILDHSKLEAGAIELETIDFSLQDLVEDVVELFSPKAAEKGLEVAADVDEGARQAFNGDPTRLRQVALNLFSNALKFTESGYVAIKALSTPAAGGRSTVRVEVHDTGIGLTEEAKGKLFQKFQQADGSITRKYGGTGLGLSISRELVQLMDGDIGVLDRPGGGSIFWFELELAPGEIPPVREACSLNAVRVLIVDDLDLNRFIFARQLEREGAVVDEVDGGAACLAAIAAAQAAGHPYEIVLLDHQMPDISGDEVAQAIRRRSDWWQPRIVITSSIGDGLSCELQASGSVDALLTKPVRAKVLVDCLNRVIAPAAATAQEARSEDGGADEAASGHVLLAEDNDINALLASTILQQVGFSVHRVCNGREAVGAAAQEAFDLIVMDVQMPVMDGLEAARRIRAQGGAAAVVPIIAMTANAMRSDREACLASGMNDFIAKPFDPEAFLRVLQRVATGVPPALDERAA